MSPRCVHQVVVGAARNDAITSMALEIREILQRSFESRIYSYHPFDGTFPSYVQGLKEMSNDSSDDILIYHLSFGIPALTEFLLSCKQRLVLIYHNVTPPHFYVDLLPEFAEALEYGRQEALLLKEKTDLAVGVSEYNASELREWGFHEVHVISSGVNPYRLADTPSDAQLLMELQTHFPEGYLLFVSQVLPHKRVEHAFEIIHLLRTVHRLNVGLVVAGPMRQPAYEFALNELRSRLHDSHILMMGSVSDKQLAALYRSCICYIGTSEHEGLSLPPLEAMANRAPVVVRGSGAIPETVGEGGIVLPSGVGILEFTETIAEVIQNPFLRSRLRFQGMKRVTEGFVENTAEELVRLVSSELG